MSWDLYIDDDYVAGPTHNLNHIMRSASVYPREVPVVGVAAEVLFRAEKLGTDWGSFDGRPAREVAVFAADLRRELERDPAHYNTMNPANGWGSRENLIEVCDMVIKAAAENPDGLWRAS